LALLGGSGSPTKSATAHYDDLFFVGSQMNNIYSMLEVCDDSEGRELAYQVEQECC